MEPSSRSAVTKTGEEGPSQGSANTASYLNYLTRQRLLTFKEECELSARILKGDARAKDRLVEANMRLVMDIARSYHNSQIPFEDLIQEGAIGLMMAAERYDSSKGYRFSTYATLWIKQAISRAMDNKARAIRIPAHISEILRKLEGACALLTRELGEEPTTEQIAARLGVSGDQILALLQVGQQPISLDMLVGEEENTTLASLLTDQLAVNPQEALLSRERRKELSQLLTILSPKERELMFKRLGFTEGSAPETRRRGERPRLSRERDRQIEIQALRKLQFAAKRREVYL